jgi:hypothetical protein
MKRFGLMLALIVVGLAAWAGWTYATTEGSLRDIASRLPSEEALDSMPLEQTGEALKLAMIQCGRVASLQANPLARLLRGDEIKSLAEHCDLIKSRQDALQGTLRPIRDHRFAGKTLPARRLP